jgi:hypothetical protein
MASGSVHNQEKAERLAQSWHNGNFSQVRFQLRNEPASLYAHVALELQKLDEGAFKKFLLHLKNNPGWWAEVGQVVKNRGIPKVKLVKAESTVPDGYTFSE